MKCILILACFTWNIFNNALSYFLWQRAAESAQTNMSDLIVLVCPFFLPLFIVLVYCASQVTSIHFPHRLLMLYSACHKTHEGGNNKTSVAVYTVAHHPHTSAPLHFHSVWRIKLDCISKYASTMHTVLQLYEV